MLGWDFRKSPTALASGIWKGIVHGPALDVARLPVARPVPVAVVAARPVLVDQAVAVVVDALLPEHDVIARLAVRHGLEGVRVGPADPVVALPGDALADLLDDAVPVDVLGRVLVEDAVVVVVDRDVARPGVAAGALHEVLPPVGVDRGDDVEDALVDEAGDVVDAAVILHEVPDGVKADLAALDLVAVDVGLDVHAGLTRFGPRRRVVDRHEHEVAAVVALADRLELEEFGEGVPEALHVGVELVGVVPAVEIELDLEGRVGGFLGRGRRRQRQDRRAGQDEEQDLAGSHLRAPFTSG